ncbi:MAG: hypothetical protein IJ555_13885 [Ruminococcus sp.]|nr:hypothetical protein [Ruminococcus sp.]
MTEKEDQEPIPRVKQNVCIEYTVNVSVLAEVYESSDTFDFYDSRESVASEWPDLYIERHIYSPEVYPDSKFAMEDGSEMTVDEALAQAEKIIEKVYSNELLDRSVGLKLSRIGVHKVDDGNYVINLRYRQIREGLPVNDDGTYTFIDFDDKQMKFTYFDISFIGNDHPMFIRNMGSTAVESKEKLESIMSWEEAKKALADGLAPNMKFTVTEAGLRYCCITDSVSEYDYLRPMWTFVLEDPTFDNKTIKKEDLGNLEVASPFQYYQRTMGYVDAVTGDVYYLNCSTQTFAKYDNKHREFTLLL